MKNTHFFKNSILVFFLFMGFTVFSQKKHIAVAIAVGKACTSNTDLGYQVYTGSKLHEVLNLAEDKVKRDNPDFFRVSIEKNGYDADKGNHIVIIEHKSNYKGCNIYGYGVGFGFNYTESLKNAKKNLAMKKWNWIESKHGYKQVYYEKF